MAKLFLFAILVCVSVALGDHDDHDHGHNEDMHLTKFDMFAMKVFQHMTHGNKDNIMYSPYLMKNMLFSIMLGSEGDTYKELFEMMGIDKNEDKPHYTNEWAKIYKAIEDNDVVQMKMKYFVDNSLTFTKAYTDMLEHTMHATWMHADTHDATKMTEAVKEWFKEISNGHAKFDHTFTGERETMLVGGLKTHGIFKYKIQETDTKKMDFHMTETDKHEEDFFTFTANMHGGFCHHLEADVAMIPMTNTGNYFVMMVPTKQDGIDYLMDNLHRVDIPEYKKIMPMKKIKMTMPKFTMNSEMHMNEFMKGAGIEHMFHEDELKDFTEGDSSMKMPDMFAKLTLKVDEHGAMTMKDDTHEHQGTDSTMKEGDELTIITANHPFAFAIVNEYGRIFHLGRVMCPH